MVHKYTPEQVAFIKANVYGRSREEMTVLFNKQFGLDLKISQITAFIKNRHLRNGLDARFPKGGVPFNKGKKGIGGWEPTQFKAGAMPWNYKPVGTERINGEGYVDIKIADPKTWKAKHAIVWEEVNGPVPKGMCLIFADSNKLNVVVENLILISRAKLAVLNKRGLITDDADLTRVGAVIADVYLKMSERRKGRGDNV